MLDGKPITTFLIVALVLWGVYLWRQGRLGQVQMLPHPAQAAAAMTGPPAPVTGPPAPGTPGWYAIQPRTPGIAPGASQ